MRRGTTPNITATVNADLTDMAIHLAFKAGCLLIVKTGDDLTVTTEEVNSKTITHVSTTLTQEETLSMRVDHDATAKCEVQIRAVEANGTVALATTIGTIPVKRILEDGVING